MSLFTFDTCTVVAEIGINHNGSIDLALEMIRAAHRVGCDAVKFQKRTVDVVYSAEELARPRVSPLGETNGDLKRGLEFGRTEYERIAALCAELGIVWYASPWDEASVDFLVALDVPYLKIASASVTDRGLLVHAARSGVPLLISTGMCDLKIVEAAVETIEAAGGEIACLYHCTSTYPALPEEINLAGISTLRERFPHLKIGYSGHEEGILPSILSIAFGAVSVERHFTLDRAMWGSDQAASIDAGQMKEMIEGIRLAEKLRGNGVIDIYGRERPIMEKLRRKDTLASS
ncbi:N-acetylneuraminate synthase family protein [Stappia taiwanensis]|uniref:N-acetylneuraminate synthase family protein n=1 Tax=Stappia taiwanensis TaxID=992267 RepID=A0A838XN53_9HYPH|nr:N-acetylneuraminate synthase family protein [Stappia taiwanensis]MBA4610441.1 N-acetylneuraminate synthase family protein [Stappia taiwanensis]GGE84972.1 sialic acid synthase [Stappia taiwanensis]